MTPTLKEDLRFWEVLAFGAYFLGLIAIGVYAFAERELRVFGILSIVGTAAWLAGTVLGFLFGVPRVRAAEPVSDADIPQTSVVPNTNLEQISDWLTKIIVARRWFSLDHWQMQWADWQSRSAAALVPRKEPA